MDETKRIEREMNILNAEEVNSRGGIVLSRNANVHRTSSASSDESVSETDIYDTIRQSSQSVSGNLSELDPPIEVIFQYLRLKLNDDEMTKADESVGQKLFKRDSEVPETATMESAPTPLVTSQVELLSIKVHDALNRNTTFNKSSLFATRRLTLHDASEFDEKLYFMTSMLRDKIQQINSEVNGQILDMYREGKRFIRNSVTQLPGHDANVAAVRQAVIEITHRDLRRMVQFAKAAPGISDLCLDDLNHLLYYRLFSLWFLINSPTYINGEQYYMLPNNVTYTCAWVKRLFGKEVANHVFEFHSMFSDLELTHNEIALLIPLTFCITKDNETYRDRHQINMLHEYYKRVLLYEFDLNMRDAEYTKQVEKIFEKMDATFNKEGGVLLYDLIKKFLAV